jgi:hypothetical protein
MDQALGPPGSGRYCRVCSERINTTEIEAKLDDSVAFLPGCYLIWVEAVRRIAS